MSGATGGPGAGRGVRPGRHDRAVDAGAPVQHAGRSRLRHLVFFWSVLLKGVDGAVETLAGILLLVTTPVALQQLAMALTARELAQDPTANPPEAEHWIATHVLGLAQGLTASTTTFAAIYLLAHGVVKVVLVWAVLREKLWAFPGMLALLASFIAYQSYELVVHFSWGLVALTVFDVVIVWLTALEWRARRREIHERQELAAAPVLPAAAPRPLESTRP